MPPETSIENKKDSLPALATSELSNDASSLFERVFDSTRFKSDGLSPPVTDREHQSIAVSIKESDDLRELNQISRRIDLDLSWHKLNDGDLQKLNGINYNLHSLDISGSAVTDDGILHLEAFPRLNSLDLGFTEVTGLGIRRLSAQPSLAKLGLKGTGIDDRSLPSITWLRSLKELDLNMCPISNAGVATLSAMSLEKLTVSGPRITSTASFERMSRLKELTLVDTGIEYAQVQELRKKMPGTKIVWKYGRTES